VEEREFTHLLSHYLGRVVKALGTDEQQLHFHSIYFTTEAEETTEGVTT
jgi:hypothetical protein